jgi:transposase
MIKGMRPYGKAEQLEKRRLKAISLLKSGMSFREVGEQVGCSLSSVVRWNQAYRQCGWRGLQPKPNLGRPALLSPRQKRQLQEILLRGPMTLGYPTELWTLKRVGEIVARRFGIRYSVSNLWKLMRSLGWSCQKPEKRARERDERAIAHWKRYRWPHIKKRRAAAGSARISR